LESSTLFAYLTTVGRETSFKPPNATNLQTVSPNCIMDRFLAYLDESGGHGFEFSKEGTSTHFVICAILIDNISNITLTEEFEKIKLKYNPTSEIKSSRIGGNEKVRLKLLNEIKSLEFKFYCLVIDKRHILPESGLRYKEVFYKFLYGILYNNLFRTFRNLSIIADEMISDEFMQGFKNYVLKNHTVDLFHQDTFEFKNGKTTTLLQLADLIGGTVNRYYSNKSDINVKELLSEKFLGEIIWPQNYKPYTIDESEIIDEYKDIIAELSILRIDSYLNKYRGTKELIIQKRLFFLNYLKSIFLYNSKTRYIFTDEIIDHIEKLTGERIKEQFFRQQIVGPLRTEGILISSNSKGYKIPCSMADILAFFNLSSRIIHPMLYRLKMTNDALIQATNGKLDILNNPEFDYLRKSMN